MSTIIPETTLPTDTSLAYSHEMAIDIDLSDGTGEPAWQRIRYITNFDPQVSPVMQDAPTYEDKGAPSATKTSESWSITFDVQEQHRPDGSLMQETARLRAATEPDANGRLAEVPFRWYDWPAGARAIDVDNAYSGIGTVSLVRRNTGADGQVGVFGVTITGKGRRAKIEHPNAEPTP